MLGLLSLVFVTVANLILGFVLIANNPKATANRALATFTFALATWNIVSYLPDATLGRHIIILISRSDFSLSVLMAYAFLVFCMALTKKKYRAIGFLNILLGVTNISLILSGQTFHLRFEGIRILYSPSWGYAFFVAHALLSVFGGIYILINKYVSASGREKSQLRYIILGVSLTGVLLILTNMVLPNFFEITPLVSRLGIYSTIFIVASSAYAIIKHRLFDIRLVVARTFTYFLLLISIAGIYGAAIFTISNYVFPTSELKVGQSSIYIVLAIILAFTFQPLRRFFELLTDRVFFRNRYDTQVVLSNIGRILTSELMIDPLLDKSLAAICTNIHIEWGQFIIFQNERIYKISHHGNLPNKLVVASSLAHLGKSILVADELEGGIAKEVMDDHSISVSVVLRTKGEFVGYLLLGEKLSGEIYSTQDINLLRILSSQLAVAIENAKAYAEIAQFNETLQEKVRQATKRLRAANTNLKELDKAKDEFISMASHQLRTPLTAIKGYLSMILEGDMGPVATEQVEFLTYAYDGSERMVTLISDLLNVSRMSAGRFLIERQPTDVVAMVADEVRQLQSTAKAKNLLLRFTPPTKVLPLVMLDEGKTRQVIMNLIDNALYYTKEGSVTVSMDVKDRTFELRVKDTGIGVPPEAHAKLFSKFFRAANAQNVRPDGTGLGLYLAKRVVEDQGGTLIFETEMGKGSTFGFQLPILAAAPPIQPK